MMRRARRVLALSVAGLLSCTSIACDEPPPYGSSGGVGALVGTWDLTRLDGNALPAGATFTYTFTLLVHEVDGNTVIVPEARSDGTLIDCIERSNYTYGDNRLTLAIIETEGSECVDEPGDTLRYEVLFATGTRLTLILQPPGTSPGVAVFRKR